MGNTCKPMAVSFQCMTKSTTIKNNNNNNKFKKIKGQKEKKYIYIYNIKKQNKNHKNYTKYIYEICFKTGGFFARQ